MSCGQCLNELKFNLLITNSYNSLQDNHQPVSHSVSQVVRQSISQTVRQSVRQAGSQSVGRLVVRSVGTSGSQ